MQRRGRCIGEGVTAEGEVLSACVDKPVDRNSPATSMQQRQTAAEKESSRH
jgi:hypothetical protein